MSGASSPIHPAAQQRPSTTMAYTMNKSPVQGSVERPNSILGKAKAEQSQNGASPDNDKENTNNANVLQGSKYAQPPSSSHAQQSLVAALSTR
jgi:hypothetical protein